MKPTAEQPVYVFRSGKYMPWKGRACVVEARGNAPRKSSAPVGGRMAYARIRTLMGMIRPGDFGKPAVRKYCSTTRHW